MTRTPRWIRSPWAGGIVLILGAILSAAFYFQEPTGVAGQETKKVNREPLGGLVCFGLVDSESGVLRLGPLQHGSVAEILCYEGQQVREGQPLLKMNSEPFVNVVAKAEAGVKVTESKLAQAQQALEQHKEGIKARDAAVDGAN